jgi:hypothetical protein
MSSASVIRLGTAGADQNVELPLPPGWGAVFYAVLPITNIM